MSVFFFIFYIYSVYSYQYIFQLLMKAVSVIKNQNNHSFFYCIDKDIETNNNFGLFVLQGSQLSSHDYVFWCGDFNYRIDLPNAQTKELVKDKAWSELMSNDQLLIQKAEGKVCQGEKNYFTNNISPPVLLYSL